MKNKILVALIFLGFAFQPVLAGPNLVPAHNTKSHVPVNVMIPAHAVEVADGVFDLGVAQDIDGRPVHGYAFVYYEKGFAKPDNPGGNGKGNGKGGGDTSDPASSCYDFMAKGARWKTTEPYVVASNVDSSAVARDFEAWDSQVVFDIIGSQDLESVVDGVDTISTDGKNEIMFGNIEDEGAIAVAIVWGVFSGNPAWRELVEYDVVFDSVDYTWGDATLDPSVMDFENIATHEFGHTVGLADLYSSDCVDQTMYGYADFGEVNKRTLEVGDINGIKALYK